MVARDKECIKIVSFYKCDVNASTVILIMCTGTSTCSNLFTLQLHRDSST